MFDEGEKFGQHQLAGVAYRAARHPNTTTSIAPAANVTVLGGVNVTVNPVFVFALTELMHC